MVKTIPKSFKALEQNPKVHSVSYEPEQSYKEPDEETGNDRECGSVYWVYLDCGWYYDDIGRHSLNGTTIVSVKEKLKSVFPCSCVDCNSLKKQ